MSESTNIDVWGERRKGAQWLLERQRERKAIREKVHRAHIEYASSGLSHDESYAKCAERFSSEYAEATGTALSERIFKNIVGRPMGAVADSLTEAKLITKLTHFEEDLADASAEVDQQLDRIDESPDDWVEIEMEETTGGKYSGVKVKKLPKDEAKLRLLERKLEHHDRFWNSVKALLPKSNLNIFVKGGDVAMLDESDLRSRLAKFDKTEVIDTSGEIVE